MDKQRAIEILHALADGVHPITGEVFPEDSPYQHPDIVRALCFFARKHRLKKPRMPKKGPPRAGSRWDKAEDDKLIMEFDSKIPIKLIAEKHQRTLHGIAARLVRLGKISERDDVLRGLIINKDSPIPK